MAIRTVQMFSLALLLAVATLAVPFPAQAGQASPPTGLGLPEEAEPRLPAGPLAGVVGTPLLVEVRKDVKDTDYPFSLQVDVLTAPAGAKLDVQIESYSLFLLADAAGTYTIRVRGIQQRSVG